MKRILWRALPPLLLLAFYWQGLFTWFYQDDFGWLNVRRDIHAWTGVPAAVFVPKAHGNMRPLSETGFFTLFSAVFGMDALPFRICVFLTQIAALALLGAIVRRLTRSEAAGFASQVLWTANLGLAVVMCWTSIFNQALCAFFLLLAFYCLLRYLESEDRRWWLGQWSAFLLGFGALETNVVYPALAAAWTWYAARKHFRKTLPLFAGSAAFVAVHFAAAPPPAGGDYALHLDGSIAATLWTYWKMALGPLPVTVPLTLAAALLVWRVRGAWLGLAWFLLPLAPFLPLRDHVMDYYLAVPAIGLAMLGAWGAAEAVRHGAAARAAAIVALGAYLAAAVPAAHAVFAWHVARSRAVENMVQGVAEIHRLDPRAAILLAGVNTDLFLSGMAHVPFRVMEIPRVYLVPGSEAGIQAAPELVGKFVLPEALARAELDAGRAVIYDASTAVLRNVTTRYRGMAASLWSSGPPRFVNFGDPVFAPYLGPGWGPARDGHRPMERRAGFRIGGPRDAGQSLWLGVFSTVAPNLRVTAAGMELGPAGAVRYSDRTDTRYAFPPALLGRTDLEVTVESRAAVTFGFAEVR